MYCCSPNIILNRKLYKHLSRWGNKLMYCDGESIYPLHGKLPSPTFVGANVDNYKDWSILTPDGELIPIFMLVPCNKCELCRELKAKHWSTRASCETQSSTYPPVFVTLTFEDNYLPDNGLEKEHIQKFLKRFRINWLRTYNVPLDLRYFAVGEYGSKFHRPHYHLLLWNVPNHREHNLLELKRIQEQIDLAWSEVVSKEEFEKLPSFLRVGNNRRLFGITEVTPDKGNSAGYCMKYMKKPCFVPDGKNPMFHLSSRRGGGLGSRYLDTHLSEFRDNYRMTTIPVNGYNYSLPRSFKDKIFPPLSNILPSHIRNQMERLNLIYCYVKSNYDCENDIVQFIASMHDATMCRYGNAYKDIISSMQLYSKEALYPLPKYPTFQLLDDLYLNAYVIYRQLYDYQPNVSAIEKLMDISESRSEYLKIICSNLPDINIEHELYELRYRNRLASHREVF